MSLLLLSVNVQICHLDFYPVCLLFAFTDFFSFFFYLNYVVRIFAGPAPMHTSSVKPHFSAFFCGIAFCFVDPHFRRLSNPKGKPEHQFIHLREDIKYPELASLLWTGLASPPHLAP